MHIQQLLNCQISKWSPQFRQVTYKTKLIDLPADFVDYLTADGIFLPEGSAAVSFIFDGRRLFQNQYVLLVHPYATEFVEECEPLPVACSFLQELRGQRHDRTRMNIRTGVKQRTTPVLQWKRVDR